MDRNFIRCGAPSPDEVVAFAEEVAARLDSALGRDEHFTEHGFRGGPAVWSKQGIAVGVLSEPQQAGEVLPDLVRRGFNAEHPSRFLVMPELPTAVFLPHEVLEDLKTLSVSLRHSTDSDLKSAAEKLIRQYKHALVGDPLEVHGPA